MGSRCASSSDCKFVIIYDTRRGLLLLIVAKTANRVSEVRGRLRRVSQRFDVTLREELGVALHNCGGNTKINLKARLDIYHFVDLVGALGAGDDKIVLRYG